MTGLDHYLTGWDPQPTTTQDVIGPQPPAALAAVLDVPETAPAAGDALPPLWHWLFFLEAPAHRDLGPDGHPAAGHFLPPLPERTRMFAGGRLQVTAPLVVGGAAERRSRLGAVNIKQGRSGEMAFVTVRHEIYQDDQLKLVEEQDLVYRSGAAAAKPATPPPPPVPSAEPAPPGTWTLPLVPDTALLFRFSALTANAHRIHYDFPYARDVEGYPGLVVHGPLLAIAMLEPLRRQPVTSAANRAIASLAFRLRRPVFVPDTITVVGEPAGENKATFAVHPASAPSEIAASAEISLA